MDGFGDRVQKTSVGVGSKVDGYSRCRRGHARDFDIEHHFAIGAVGIAGRQIDRTVDGDGGHLRNRQSELAEVRQKILGTIAAAQLDQGNALTGAGSAHRKVVEPHDLRGRVAGQRRQATQACPGLRPVVETQHGNNHPIQLLGNMNRFFTAAVRSVAVVIDHQRDAERLLKLRYGARDNHAAPPGASANHGKPVRLRKIDHFAQIFLRRGMAGVKLIRRQVRARCRRTTTYLARGGSLLRWIVANDDRHFEALIRGRRIHRPRAAIGGPFAAR